MRHDHTQRRLSLISFDDLFNSIHEPIIINKIDFNHTDYSEKIREMLYGKSADLTFIAECDCGYFQGNVYEGMRCPECHTVAKIGSGASSGILSNTAWLSFPDYIPGVLHTRIYDILSKWLRLGNQNKSYLDVILDPEEEEPADIAGVFPGRGYQYFYDNFDEIMRYFMYTHKKTASKDVVPYIQYVLTQYRHIVFCKHLPILPDKLHTAVSTSPNGRAHVEHTSQYIIEAANKLSFLEYSPNKIQNPKRIDKMIHDAYRKYMVYASEGIVSMRLGKKNSLPRQHIFGSRFHWSFRSVITPLPGPHRYDEMHIPWCIGVNLLRHHIISRLISAYDYDPSLKKGSIQKLFITKVKTDMSDNTISFSVLVLKDPNADFDGDEMTGNLIMEADMADEMEVLHPARRYLDTNAPHVGTSITLPPASLLVWNSFLGRV